MRILLTNNHLNTFGGTETWTYTMYKAFKKLGHEVVVFTLKTGGGISDKLDNIVTDLKNLKDTSFDLCVVNHNRCLSLVTRYVNASKVVFTCHGIYPTLERPVEGADKYVGISLETSNYITKLGFKSSGYIHNPIDLDEYCPTKELSNTPDTLLSFCQNSKTIENLRRLQFKINETKKGWLVRKLITPQMINEVDITCSLGRGVYESLACGRPVIVYDERSYNKIGCYDGVITKENIDSLLENNCSGRKNNLLFSAKQIMEEVRKSYVNDVDYYRSIAEDRFDSIKAATKYIEL